MPQMLNQQPEAGPNPIEDSCLLRGPIDFRLLTNINQIASVSMEWDGLLSQSRCNRAYSCSKWYLATVELLPQLQPLVFTAWRNSVLSGLLPLWLDVDRRLARIGDGFIDHLDIIAADEDLGVITGLLDLALQYNESYDRLILGPVKQDSNLVKGTRALGLGEIVDEFFEPNRSLIYAVVDLTSGYDQYMKTLSRGFRRNLYRKCKKAQTDGLIIRELTPAELKSDLFVESFLSLHLIRFGDRSDVKSSESWIRKLFPALFAEGRLRVFAALDASRIVAIDTATVTPSGMYGMLGGFVPEMSRYGLGKLLIHHAIQQACLEGMDEYDLGWWQQDYKADWKPASRAVGPLQIITRPKLHKTSQGPQKHPGTMAF